MLIVETTLVVSVHCNFFLVEKIDHANNRDLVESLQVEIDHIQLQI